jgi:hypothetical protein
MRLTLCDLNSRRKSDSVSGSSDAANGCRIVILTDGATTDRLGRERISATQSAVVRIQPAPIIAACQPG